MINKILLQRICKMIAISYALQENEVIYAYDKTNSIDAVLTGVLDSIANHTTLQYEISKGKK